MYSLHDLFSSSLVYSIYFMLSSNMLYVLWYLIEMYDDCLSKCRAKLKEINQEEAGRRHTFRYISHLTDCNPSSPLESYSIPSTSDKASSVQVIHLDVMRTFPTLGFFQKVRQ